MTLKVNIASPLFLLPELPLLVKNLIILRLQMAPILVIASEYGHLITLWRLFATGKTKYLLIHL